MLKGRILFIYNIIILSVYISSMIWISTGLCLD